MKRLNLKTLLTGMLLLLPALASADVIKNRIDMYVGEIKVLEDIDVERVAIGKGSLIKVKTLPKSQLLIIGEQAGSTSMRLWFRDGHEQDVKLVISEKDHERHLRLEDMIKMEVKIIEFRKSALKELGINWQSQINGPIGGYFKEWGANPYYRILPEDGTDFSNLDNLPARVDPAATYFGLATSITSKINFMASNGDAFTLAEPNLSCVNGGKASFLAGGEVPIPITGRNGEVVVDYKEYGIRLQIEPEASPEGVISTVINTEVSQVDPSVSVRGVPGFLTRRTETQMNVKDKETIVISGMLNSEDSKDVDKLPLLGDIPIIGHLFKSTRFRDTQTELAIFVTPTIVSAKSQSNVMEIERYNKRKDKRMKRIEEKLDIGLVD